MNIPKSRKKKSLKNRISKYILKKQDICCEADIDRKIVIEQIFEKYKKISSNMGEPNQYLNNMNNDIILFIGYYVDLEKNNDIKGMKLWNEIDKRMLIITKTNTIVDEQKVKQLFHDVPLFYLLSFLGFASYSEQISNKSE